MRLFDYCERGNDKAKQGDIIGLRVVFHCAHIKAICRNDALMHKFEANLRNFEGSDLY